MSADHSRTLPRTADASSVRATGYEARSWQRAEAPTWLMLAGTYVGWMLLTWHSPQLPWWVLLPLGGYFVCLHGSLQHEAVHGHPTPRRFINTLLVLPPLGLWMPYAIYRDTHLEHHRTSDLTVPEKDPESFYIPAERWTRMSKAAQTLLVFNNTLLGRLSIGPLITVSVFWFREARRLLRGDHKYLGVCLRHAVAVVALLWWIVAVCEMPVWQYLVFFAWPGLSLTLLRSFLEHRPAAARSQRTAIVEGTALTRLLFLNNNYHTLHHEQPATPWYKLPKIYQRERDRILAANGGYLYRDYGEITRRFLLKCKDHPIHPISSKSQIDP